MNNNNYGNKIDNRFDPRPFGFNFNNAMHFPGMNQFMNPFFNQFMGNTDPFFMNN